MDAQRIVSCGAWMQCCLRFIEDLKAHMNVDRMVTSDAVCLCGPLPPPGYFVSDSGVTVPPRVRSTGSALVCSAPCAVGDVLWEESAAVIFGRFDAKQVSSRHRDSAAKGDASALIHSCAAVTAGALLSVKSAAATHPLQERLEAFDCLQRVLVFRALQKLDKAPQRVHPLSEETSLLPGTSLLCVGRPSGSPPDVTASRDDILASTGIAGMLHRGFLELTKKHPDLKNAADAFGTVEDAAALLRVAHKKKILMCSKTVVVNTQEVSWGVYGLFRFAGSADHIQLSYAANAEVALRFDSTSQTLLLTARATRPLAPGDAVRLHTPNELLAEESSSTAHNSMTEVLRLSRERLLDEFEPPIVTATSALRSLQNRGAQP